MNASPDWELEQLLRESLGSPPKADFDRWRAGHGDVVAYLNPVVTQTFRNRRRMIMRITSAAVAVVVLVSFVSQLTFQQESFAQTVKAINTSTAVTWKMTTYTRFFSTDGKRTWLRAELSMEMAYRSPNLYRDTRYDQEGKVRSVEIVDAASNKALLLDMKLRRATWLAEPTNQYGMGGPFSSVAMILKTKPVEQVTQKELNGAKINVFRFRREGQEIPNDQKTVDIWLDATTKKLVQVCDPGADSFDPDTAPDRDHPAEEHFSKAQGMGTKKSDIVFDAELAPELFSLSPPEGFEIIHQPPYPTVTEADLIEWLGVTARFNDGTFFDTYRGFDLERYNKAANKKEADRTKVEQKMVDLQTKHMRSRNGVVMASFANEYTVGGHFRYIGRGVKLGSANQIVMFYQLKSGGYRAIYGDLTVKDIAPKDLPLPIEE